MKKRIISILAILILCFNLMMPVVHGAGLVTLYSWDNRSQMFFEEEVEDQLKVGWYRMYPVELWAEDGRELMVGGDEVETYLGLNWYLNEDTVIYITDWGQSIYIPTDLPENIYTQFNWYSEPPVKMYSEYAEIMYVPKHLSPTYKNLNWFYTEPVWMWSRDGRYIPVEEYDVEAYKNVGWFEYDEDNYPTTMYTLDGKEILVAQNEIETYKKLGWYDYTDISYYKFKNESQKCMNAGDYEGVYEAFEDCRWVVDDTKYQEDVYNVRYRAREAWRKQAGGCPLAFTGYQEIEDGKVTFEVRNISYKEIIAVELDFMVYDIFGYPLKYCYDYRWGVNGDLLMECDESRYFYTSYISGISNAHCIDEVVINTVVCSDGSIWYRGYGWY